MSNEDTVQATAAHEEYMAEANRLISEQIEALFGMINAAIPTAGGDASAGRGVDVSRAGHTLTVTAGERTVTFTVEAITDLPEGADRAQAFPTGQARCVVRGADGTETVWVLHRIGAGDLEPRYAWMHTDQTTPVTEADIAAAL